MNKLNWSKMANDIRSGLQKHSPEILTGIGIAGLITTTALAVRATPKALLLIEEKKIEEDVDKLKPVEVVRTTWTCYIPATVTGALSIACLVGASSVSLKRNTALATAYSLSESALKTYQEKVIETIGEKKEKEIRDEIAKGQLKKDPLVNKEVIVTGKGETLCYDTISGRYFKCDIEKIRRVEAMLNKELYSSMYVSLNDFYYEIGLRSTELGDELGWNTDMGPINFDFSSQLAEDDTPCLVINYHIAPRYDYRTLM